jgi:hypothetical protein
VWQSYELERDRILLNAHEVLSQSNNHVASEVFAYVTERLVLGRPHGQGLATQTPRRPDSIVLVPVMGTDAGTAVAQALIAGDGTACPAMYSAPNRTIGVDCVHQNLMKLRGILFIHECFHAAKIDEDPANIDPENYWRHERDAWCMHTPILSDVYGEPYVQVLNVNITIMRKMIKSAGGKVGENFIQKYKFPPILKQIIGQPQSEMENMLIGSQFVTHAQLELIARDRPDDAASCQTRLIKQILGNDPKPDRTIS